MDTALVVACISGVVALGNAAFTGWTQLHVTKQERERRAEERRSDAKVVLDRYRGPLLDAASQLGDRVDNIRNGDFFRYLSQGSGREQDTKLTTLFRFAYYLGWREFVRREVQLLRFENEEDTRLVAAFLNDVTWVFSSDKPDGTWAMLWGDEQRGIGELMIEQSSGTASIVRGHAAFHRDYDQIFAPWMERFASDLFSPAIAVKSNRLRLLQWMLCGLVRQLDEEGAYGGGWIDRSVAEIRKSKTLGSSVKHEEQLRKHLETVIKPSTSFLSGVSAMPNNSEAIAHGCTHVPCLMSICVETACLDRLLLAGMDELVRTSDPSLVSVVLLVGDQGSFQEGTRKRGDHSVPGQRHKRG